MSVPGFLLRRFTRQVSDSTLSNIGGETPEGDFTPNRSSAD